MVVWSGCNGAFNTIIRLRLYAWLQDRHLFNGLILWTTRVSWQQKGKTILDFNEASNDQVAAASAGPYVNHLNLVPDR